MIYLFRIWMFSWTCNYTLKQTICKLNLYLHSCQGNHLSHFLENSITGLDPYWNSTQYPQNDHQDNTQYNSKKCILNNPATLHLHRYNIFNNSNLNAANTNIANNQLKYPYGRECIDIDSHDMKPVQTRVLI